MRGIDLNPSTIFIRQLNEPDGERVGVPTLFFPMTRVEASRSTSQLAPSPRWTNFSRANSAAA